MTKKKEAATAEMVRQHHQLNRQEYEQTVGDSWVSQVAQWENMGLPKWETQVWSLGQEDPLEDEMATDSNTLDWGSPWTEEPGRLQSMG